jgi:hypothetical protein
MIFGLMREVEVRLGHGEMVARSVEVLPARSNPTTVGVASLAD